MRILIRKFLNPFIPRWLRNFRRKQLGRKQLKKWQKMGFLIPRPLKEWQKSGCPIPAPHIVKQITIQEYQQKYGYSILVETGTYLGDMVEAQKGRFKEIISIELGIDLFEKAKKRFANNNNVIILQGDSGKVLPDILKDLNEPAIFWLDGHYSEGITAKGDKECPIFEELDAILQNKKSDHILLIDDARCFIGRGDYPGIEDLSEYIKRKDGKYHLEVKHDIIRCVIQKSDISK